MQNVSVDGIGTSGAVQAAVGVRPGVRPVILPGPQPVEASASRPSALAQAPPSTADYPRVRRLAAVDPGTAELVERLIRLAVDGLPTMLLGDGVFAFTRRGVLDDGRAITRLEGRSLRYTGMVVLGARHLPREQQHLVLGERSASDAADHLVSRLPPGSCLGDVAVVAWAVAQTGGEHLAGALENLDRTLDRCRAPSDVEVGGHHP